MPTRPNSKPLIKSTQLARLERLLDMLYRPAEIADELGINIDTVYRTYIKNGLPHTQDERGHIWIHGPAASNWIRSQFRARRHRKMTLPENHAWCLKCRIPAPIINSTSRPLGNKRVLLQAACPRCGRTINRIARRSE